MNILKVKMAKTGKMQLLGLGLMVPKKQRIECGSNGTVIRVGDAQPTYLQSS